ncbi:hypothetical protein Dsin_027198 [Dipteronia sinensis]|uniref:Reverse transcriptase domain-containing protein n=1 Tax=Dipteronia sinensis TaxID=43782 RepID=A0AAE0DYR7_9ROSI|nr:hypothetical protein Dsin_027198 [Dipteronia sinensis]
MFGVWGNPLAFLALKRVLKRGSKQFLKRGGELGFKFEPFWLNEEDCGMVIASAWGEVELSNSDCDLSRKLSVCARKLEVWSTDRFGSLEKLIKSKREELEGLILIAMDVGISKEIARVESDLENLLTKEEIYWRQRSRLDWLVVGDRNLRFFHRKTSARKTSNWIDLLKDETGKKFTDEVGISGAVCRFFDILFTSSSPFVEDIGLCSVVLENKIDDDRRLVLERNFFVEDVRLAIFSLGAIKTPESDGFHTLFFQKIWQVVGGDVTRVCLSVLNGESSIRIFNKTNVVLVLKKNNHVLLRDFRPISLCYVIYKIISKAMATHLIPAIISPNKSAFVPGRLIFDNVLVAFELLHSISEKKEGEERVYDFKT